MKDSHKRAAKLLERQIQRQDTDPLNNSRREAAGRVLERILDSDGFTVLITSTKGETTSALALAQGELPVRDTMTGMLNMLQSVAKKLGVTMVRSEEISDECDCPACRAHRASQTTQ
jgi:hypothetical protein